jgi:hypothetical protein
MTRSFYRSLLWLHPPSFRRQFSGEMLWIFDEAAPAEGSVRLILDGFVSLVRQWMLGCGVWKIFAAITGAAVQISVVALLPNFLREPARQGRSLALPHLANSDLDFSRALALVVIVLVLSTAGLCAAGRSRARRG